MSGVTRISRSNARFQQWEALLHNRNKRLRLGEFLVQGVRPISLAIEHGWTVRALLYDQSRTPSTWAREVLDRVGGERVSLTPSSASP